MNTLMQNVYTVFNDEIEEYNRQRSEKIELGYIGECQGFYVFAGDWQNLFLINDKSGLEICLESEAPKTVEEIKACNSFHYWSRDLLQFSYKKFIKWLYKRNTLVKNINWTNLQTINYIKKCNTKIMPFEDDVLINLKTGKHCGTCCGRLRGVDFLTETYDYEDKPHILIRENDEMYKFYIPDKKPRTQKEMVIVPAFPFKKEFFEEKIKDLKYWVMREISERDEGEKHLKYYQLLLLYRSHNPNIKVEEIKPKEKTKTTVKMLSWISFVDFAVQEYAKRNKLNPYVILADMYEKGYIEEDNGRIVHEKRDDFIKEYSFICDDYSEISKEKN